MNETVLILDRTVDAPRAARDHVRALGIERTEDATLLISELVTNAVKYGPDGLRDPAHHRPGRCAHALHRP